MTTKINYEATCFNLNNQLGKCLGVKWAPEDPWCNDEDEVTTDWCRNNAAAFELMALYEVFPYKHLQVIEGVTREYIAIDGIDTPLVAVNDCPDKEAAIRMAIVQAVIAKHEWSQRETETTFNPMLAVTEEGNNRLAKNIVTLMTSPNMKKVKNLLSEM